MSSTIRSVLTATLVLLLSACKPTPTPQSNSTLTFDRSSISVSLDVAQGTTQAIFLKNPSSSPLTYEVIEESYVSGAFVTVDEPEATGTIPQEGSAQLNVKIECPVDAGQFNTTLKVKSKGEIAELPVTTSCNAAPIPTIVQEDTKIVTAEIGSEIISYNEQTGNLVFRNTSAYAAGLKEGDTVVSGAIAAAPDGFLRNVVAVKQQDGTIVVETDEAGLGDAFDQAEFDNTYEPTNDQIASTTVNFPGIDAQTLGSVLTSQALVNFSFKEVLFDADGNNETTDDRFTVNGNVRVENPKFDVNGGVDVKYRTLFKLFGKRVQVPSGVSVRFRSVVGVKESANLSAKGEVKFNKSKRIPIGTIRYKPITFAIGPVPVVITHNMNVFIDVGADLSIKLNYQASQSVTMKYGFEYKDNALRTVSEKSNTYDQTLDLNGSLSAWAYPGMRYNANLYGGPGMFAEVRIGAKLSATANVTEAQWKAELCGDGTVGMSKWKLIDTRIVGIRVKLELPEKSSRIFDFCNLLKSGTIKMPPQVYTLTVIKVGTGAGSVISSPEGIDCGEACVGSFPQNSTVTLTATPSEGYVLSGWDGNCVPNGNTCVVRGNAPTSVYVSFSPAVGTPPGATPIFGSAVQYSTGQTPTSLTTADFNADGQSDVAVVNRNISTNGLGASGSVSVLLGNGDGTLRPKFDYPVGKNPEFVMSADVNRDGRPDLVAANTYERSVSVLLNNGDGTFRSQLSYATGNGPKSVEVGDFNGDGLVDLATGNALANTISILMGNGDGTFRANIEFSAGTVPGRVRVADVNGDGRLDVIVTNADMYTGKVSILLGNGDGSFKPPVTYETGRNNGFVEVFDANRDGRSDIATVNSNNGSVSVLLGDGDGTFRPRVNFSVGSSPEGLVAVDINRDGLLDLVTAPFDPKSISILLGNGDGTFKPKMDIPLLVRASNLANADLNGDGRMDLITVDAPPNTVSSTTISVLLQR